MTAKLDYSSSTVDATLDPAFETALVQARQHTRPIQHFIDGQWAALGTTATHMDPCDPAQVISTYYVATHEVVQRAIAAAKRSATAWRNTAYQDRCTMLKKAAAGFSKRYMELAGIVSAETGKIRVESLAEVSEAGDLVEFYTDEMVRRNGYVFDLPSSGQESQHEALRPYGVFGVISPFNFPVALAVNMTVAALVTGNTVVLKPSAKTPRSTTEAVAILAQALPAGVLNIVQGDAPTGAALVDSPVDGIAFTGSAEVGWNISAKLARRPTPRPVLAEMGGQNPAIVSAQADLDIAASGIIRSAFGLSGQKCSACRRVIVERAVSAQLIERLVSAAEALHVADPIDRSSNLGPVIDKPAADRIQKAIMLARQDGRVLTGGRLDGPRANYFKPIIAADLPTGHRLTREEFFGPFLVIVTVDSFTDALIEANAVEYGLSAGVFTRDKRETEAFLDQIEAGVVYVNRAAGATTGAWPGVQSFCGWKSSGSTGKGGLNLWYLPGFMREQSRTIVGA